MSKSSQDLNFLQMAQESAIGQTSVPNDYLSNHHSDHSSAIISVPQSPTGTIHSVSVNSSGPIHAETSYGYLADFIDPLIIIQQCLEDKLSLVSRRLTLFERQAIRSGSIFAFIELQSKKNSDGLQKLLKKGQDLLPMKRWTDGLAWSKSRVHGHFLVYKENVKKRSMSKKQMDTELSTMDGLLKKTFAIIVDDNTWHVINYYYEDDVSKGSLATPSVIFPNVQISDKLLDPSKLRLRSHGPSRDSPSFGNIRPARRKCEKEEQYPIDAMKQLDADFGISGHLNDLVNNLGDVEASVCHLNSNEGYITLRKVHPESSDSDMATVGIPSLYKDLEQLAIETFHISNLYKFILIGPQGKVTPDSFPMLMDGDHIDVSMSSFDQLPDEDSVLKL